MRVFIANFGFENYLWPTCRDRPSVATLEDEDLRPFSLAGDRAGYVAYCLARKKTRRGITPPASVASRWFSLGATISSTDGDLWIHREKSDVWWTTSKGEPVEEVLKPAFKGATPDLRMYEIHKPADAWSNKDRRGARLLWVALHPKAQAFLFTEGTLQQLADENADYARALIDGRDLGAWHNLPAWRKVAEIRKRSAARVFDARQRAIARMIRTAIDTIAAARGQQVQRTMKVKEMRFPSEREFEQYVVALMEAQDELCALTEIPLQFDGDHEDEELLVSLDRIDSDGHYELGNLQLVCRFVNRWKNDGNNAEFLRLIQVVRELRAPALGAPSETRTPRSWRLRAPRPTSERPPLAWLGCVSPPKLPPQVPQPRSARQVEHDARDDPSPPRRRWLGSHRPSEPRCCPACGARQFGDVAGA